MISKKIMDKRTALSILKQKHVDLTQQFEAQYRTSDDMYYFNEEMIADRNFLNALKFLINKIEKEGGLK